MKIHLSLIGLALGIGSIGAPSVFAHDGVGEVIREAIELPLLFPRLVVVEREPEYRHHWRRPAYWHREERREERREDRHEERREGRSDDRRGYGRR